MAGGAVAAASAATLLLVVAVASPDLLSPQPPPPPFKDANAENPVLRFVPSSIGAHFCERIRITGKSRLNIGSYANLRRVAMNVSTSLPEQAYSKVAVCFHRNISMSLCDCDSGDWQDFQKAQWNTALSPYVEKYLDVKVDLRTSAPITLSVQEEFQKWRLVCLAIGFVFLLLAPLVSDWTPFYYSSSMALGIVLVVLILLFQGMRLLPMGKKSIFYLTIYSSVLGVGSFLVHYFSMIVSSILENFGLSEDMYNPVAVVLLGSISLIGAGLGYWSVRRFILSQDGTVDAGVSQFVKWAIRIIASIVVLQSSPDALLALCMTTACWKTAFVMGALVSRSGTTMKHKPLKSGIWNQHENYSPNNRQAQFLRSQMKQPLVTKSPRTQWGDLSFSGLRSRGANGQVSRLYQRMDAPGDEDYYSSFHKMTPRKFTKEQWDDFTEESTRNALMQHTATPEFAQWVAANANRLHVKPESSDESSAESSVGSEDEKTEESSTGRSLLSWFQC